MYTDIYIYLLLKNLWNKAKLKPESQSIFWQPNSTIKNYCYPAARGPGPVARLARG